MLNTKHIAVLDQETMRSAKDIVAVERIMKAYKTKSFWPCVDEIMKVWSEVNPGKWNELIVEVKNTKSTLKDKKYATTNSKSMERRFLLRMPDFVHNAIIKLYPNEPMNRRFFNTFARRYPAFRVSDKV